MDFLFKEITFGFLELEFSLFELLEDHLDVLEMFLLILAGDDDVIQDRPLQNCYSPAKQLKLIVGNK